VDRDTAAYYSLRAGAVVAAGVFLGALGLLVLAHHNQAMAIRWMRALVSPISKGLADKIAGMVERFIDGLKALPTVRNVFFAVLWTFLYWLINGFAYWFLALGFGLGEWVSLPVAYAMMAAVAVGMMIPNPPGNVGSFWYFLLLPLYVTGAPDQGAGALAFALSVWALMLAQYLVFSGYFLLTGKINLGRIWKIQIQKAVEE
jgi:glycosyltransferase 2 family protein